MSLNVKYIIILNQYYQNYYKFIINQTAQTLHTFITAKYLQMCFI